MRRLSVAFFVVAVTLAAFIAPASTNTSTSVTVTSSLHKAGARRPTGCGRPCPARFRVRAGPPPALSPRLKAARSSQPRAWLGTAPICSRSRFLPAGDHFIQVNYAGGSGFAASGATSPLVVAKADSTTSASGPATVYAGLDRRLHGDRRAGRPQLRRAHPGHWNRDRGTGRRVRPTRPCLPSVLMGPRRSRCPRPRPGRPSSSTTRGLQLQRQLGPEEPLRPEQVRPEDHRARHAGLHVRPARAAELRHVRPRLPDRPGRRLHASLRHTGPARRPSRRPAP